MFENHEICINTSATKPCQMSLVNDLKILLKKPKDDFLFWVRLNLIGSTYIQAIDLDAIFPQKVHFNRLIDSLIN